MKKTNLFLTIFTCLLLFNCSIDKEPQTLIIEGIDGSSTLVRTSDEPDGENCENGGIRLDFGVDLNNDGQLQETEISSTSFVCNGLDGQDGLNSLITVTPVEGTEQFPNGGVEVNIGFDLDGNGELDENEISSTTFVTNGADGQNGTDGADGQDGFDTLVRTWEVEEDSETCEEGGYGIDFGLDTNRNGILDESEITNTEVICNGEDGLSVRYSVELLQPSEDYPNGGFLVSFGLDQNDNGKLDFSEINSSFVIENGADGEDGEDGLSTITTQTVVEPTEEFPNGGVLVQSGLDLDRSGILDENEVESSAFVANGIDGTNGQDGQDGEDGEDGQDGFNSLIKTSRINPNFFFPTGAVAISTGLDTNRNGRLDLLEIRNVSFIKNGLNGTNGQDGTDGEDGFTTLVNLVDVENGTLIQTGVDTNRNNVLEDTEITQEQLVSNGTDGTNGQDGEDGTDGQDGSDGACSFIVVTDEPSGENCEFGGLKIVTGKDRNGNKEFDEEEIDDTDYLCNPEACFDIIVNGVTVDFDEEGFKNTQLRDFSSGNIVSKIYTLNGCEGYIGVDGRRTNSNKNQAMIFDTDNPTGGDDDLGVGTGNSLIISEDDDSRDPDDNGVGGVITFDFTRYNSNNNAPNGKVVLHSIDVIDIEARGSYILLYQRDNNTPTRVNIPSGGGSEIVTVDLGDLQNVTSMVVVLCESGAIDNLKLSCSNVEYTCEQ